MRILRVLMAVAWLAGCSMLSPESSERRQYDDALAGWKRVGVDEYSVVYQRSCECLPEWTRPALIVVRSGKVVEAVDFERSVSLNVDRYLTVDGLFARIGDAFDNKAYRIAVEYDRRMHYPVSVLIDEDREMIEDELQLNLSGLQRLQ